MMDIWIASTNRGKILEFEMILESLTKSGLRIKTLDDLTEIEMTAAITMLNQWIETKKKNDEIAKLKQAEMAV